MKFITILQRGGVFPIYYSITRGRGGSLGTPNLYYVIYGRPLRTIARKNWSPKRIEEYLSVIHRQSGAAKCREVLEYVVMALAKYLQITVAYDIFKGDLEKISGHFELFNEHLEALAVVFRLVTNTKFQQYVAKNKISTLPTLQVK